MVDLSRVSQIVSQISNEVQSNYQHFICEPHNFHATVLLKLLNATHSYATLLPECQKKRYLIDMIEIQLRTNMSDIITWEYIMHQSRMKDITELLKRLHYDHIDSTIQNLEKTYSVVHNHSPKTIEENISSIKNQKNEFFDSEGNPLYEPLNMSIRNAVRYIFGNKSLETDYSNISLAFDLYEYYSKVEHFGELSLYLSRRHYEDKWYLPCLRQILIAIELVVEYEIKIFPFTLKEDDITFEIVENLKSKRIELREALSNDF